MILADVMDQLGDALATISGLRVWRWPSDTITPPAAIVSYPDRMALDLTYQRGGDRITIPIVLVVGKVSDRAARDALSVYCDGAGAKSIKATIDGYDAATAYGLATVTAVEFDVFTMNSIDYLAATFDVDVVGSGT